jgi:guanylate kinase
LAGRGTETE